MAKKRSDADSYYYRLIGFGYSPAKALEKVNKKFNKQDEVKDKNLGWAWKGK